MSLSAGVVTGLIDWAAVGAVAAVVAVVVAVVIGGWQLRQGRLARDRAESAADRAEGAVLAGVTWQFRAELRPTVGTAQPTIPPIELGVSGANVWVYEVRLSWGEPEEPWTIDDAMCVPWPGDVLPALLHPTAAILRMSWPGPNPAMQRQLTWSLRVRWSVSQGGPTQWRTVDSSGLSWQQR